MYALCKLFPLKLNPWHIPDIQEAAKQSRPIGGVVLTGSLAWAQQVQGRHNGGWVLMHVNNTKQVTFVLTAPSLDRLILKLPSFSVLKTTWISLACPTKYMYSGFDAILLYRTLCDNKVTLWRYAFSTDTTRKDGFWSKVYLNRWFHWTITFAYIIIN